MPSKSRAMIEHKSKSNNNANDFGTSGLIDDPLLSPFTNQNHNKHVNLAKVFIRQLYDGSQSTDLC